MSKGLPQTWTWVKGKDLFDFVRGVSYDKRDVSSQSGAGLIAILRAGNLQDGHIRFDDLVFVPETYVRDEQLLKRGDLVIAMSSGSASIVGKVAIVKKDYPEISFGTFCGLLRPVTSDIADWLAHFFQTKNYRNAISRAAAGININNIKREHLLESDIPLAPLNDLRRIITKLEELLGRVDACRKQLEKVPPLLKQFRQSVFAAACSGLLTADWRASNPNIETAAVLMKTIREIRTRNLDNEIEIAARNGQQKPDLESAFAELSFDGYELIELPKSWEWIHIGYVGRVRGGKRLPKGESLTRHNTGQPYIRATNLKNGTVATDEILFVPNHLKEVIRNYKVKAEDVYITIVGACIGDAGVIPIELNGANLTENAAKICNLTGYESRFAAIWLRSPLCQKIIQSKILSAAQGKLALFRIEQLPLPLAPLEEQREIVRRVESLFKIADAVEGHYRQAQEQLDKLPQAILAKAFRGELVPQDPTDEPASVLLERISAQKASAGKTIRKTKQAQPKGKRQVAATLPFAESAES